MIYLSSLQDISNIFEFLASIGEAFQRLFSFLPPFLAPLALAYLALAVIYFIAGRG